MPGATPAGSLGGTGVSHCQQQAPVVGRFVFLLSLVLGLSPRTRLSCSYPSSWCFLGLDQAGLYPAHVRGDGHRAIILPLHLQELGVTSLKAEGKEGGCRHHSRSNSHAWLAAQHPET